MNKTYVSILLLAIMASILLAVIFAPSSSTGRITAVATQGFAKCLSDKGLKMYGAYWCPHCKEQKEMFGDAWQHVVYVECSLPGGKGQTEECKNAGITAYPTWELPDGKRIQGLLSLEQLSALSGCPLR
jgi:hypothetical protein